MSTAAAKAPCLTFFVGEQQFAAIASDVSEVFRRPRITRVPHGPESLLGIAGLRGAAAPIVSLARLLGGEDQVTPASRLLLLAGEQNVGLAVDRVGALVSLPVEPATDGGAGFGRLYRVEDAALRLLDLDSLLDQQFAGARSPARPAIRQAAEPEAEAQTLIALLAFELAGQAYAMPLAEVDEVIPLPAHLAVIAQSDDAALGVAENHDRLLPVVSLRVLLGLPATAAPGGRVLIARIGDARVGLAVDRLRAILRVPASTIDPAPAALNQAEGEAQVQSICRLPGSGGLVAILSGERLFRDEKMAHILADGRSGGEAMRQVTTAPARTERFLIFRLGEEEYGLPLAVVQEVARLPEKLTRVPKAPAFVEGVLNLRGQVTPVIDQRSRFASQRATGDERPRIVVTTLEGRQAGFIVDQVTEILDVDEGQIGATPELTADAGRLFSRIATLDDRLILLIEPKEMLDRAERDLLAALDASMVAPET